jgi:hypothetical protein
MDQHINTIAMQVAARVVSTTSDDIGILWEEHPDLNQEQIDAAVGALSAIAATEEPQP